LLDEAGLHVAGVVAVPGHKVLAAVGAEPGMGGWGQGGTLRVVLSRRCCEAWGSGGGMHVQGCAGDVQALDLTRGRQGGERELDPVVTVGWPHDAAAAPPGCPHGV
jgi:hypothetical protein